MMQQINIVYAPGLGGNHLANIITLDEKYKLNLNLSTYDLPGENVHLQVERQNDKVKINTMHAGGFIQFNQHKLFDSESINILLSLPDPKAESIAYQRLTCWAPEYKNNFIFSEYSSIYSTFTLSRISGCPMVSLQSSELFSENTQRLVNFLFKINITVDFLKVEELHKKWLSKMKIFIEEKKKYQNDYNH